MKKAFLLSCLLLSGIFYAGAQNYSRISITPVYINYVAGPDYSSSASSVVVPDKYDVNDIGDYTLKVNAKMVSPSAIVIQNLQNQINQLSAIKEKSKEQLKQIAQLASQRNEAYKQKAIEDSMRDATAKEAVMASRIPNKIMSSILIDKNRKVMTLDVLSKRAVYNSSDADYIKAMNSELKISAITDKGQNLLGNLYFIVYSTESVEESSASDKDSRLKNISYTGKAWLYQIDIDTLMKTGQFNNMVFTEHNPVKYDQFMNFDFPVKLIMKQPFTASTSNYRIESESGANIAKALLSSGSGNSSVVKYIMKTQDEINKEIVTDILVAADQKFTAKYVPFQVKVNVFSTNPIKAKIGKKESLRIDDLYKVTENVLRKDNTIYERKIGWVRAKTVKDNRKNADGNMEPSTFYRVASKKVEKGMKLTQKVEKGFVIGMGLAGGDNTILGGFYGNIDYITKWKPGLRIGVTVGGGFPVESKTNINNYKLAGNNLFVDLNVNKIIQANRLEITPFAGAYLGQISLKKETINGKWTTLPDSDPIYGWSYSEMGVLYGLKFGYNLGKHTQLNFGFKSGSSFSGSFKDENNEDATYSFGGKDVELTPNRAAITIGLRLFGF